MEISDNEIGLARGSGQVLQVNTVSAADADQVTVREIQENSFVIKNDQHSLVVENGCITSLVDRVNGREVIEKGKKANQIVIFDDIPLYWEAWDVEVYHLQTRRELSYGQTKIHEQKPYRVTLVTDVKISKNSSLKSYITVRAAAEGQPSVIECHAEVDWHEDSKFLKVEFPVNITSTEASYETAYGITKRPTHYNTSWDMAKFEVCCHKYADLSEHNYGVSIINDSKYGFATAGKVMRLSLLKSPKAPDENADMGKHQIRWAIFPHSGSLSAETVKAAYAFNNPMRLASASSATISSMKHAPVSLINDDASASIILDTIKRGHDDEDISTHDGIRVNKGRSIIVRMYESMGGASRATIEAAWKLQRVTKTNILEDELEEVSINTDGSFSFSLRPFEVATFKLEV